MPVSVDRLKLDSLCPPTEKMSNRDDYISEEEPSLFGSTQEGAKVKPHILPLNNALSTYLPMI